MISSANGFDGLFYGYENDCIFDYIKKYGRFSPTEITFLNSIINENDNIIEIGSNIGSHTIPFAKKIKNGKYFVFEPQNNIYQLLNVNIVVNKLENVRTYSVGIGEKHDIIYYNKNKADSNTGGFSLLRKNEPDGYDFVKITPMDEYIYPELYNLLSLKLIKIDVEGMEIIVLNQLKNLIKKFNPFIFVEYTFDTYNSIIDFAYNNKYIPYLFNTNCSQYGLPDKYCDINIFLVPENKEESFSHLYKLEKDSALLLNVTVFIKNT